MENTLETKAKKFFKLHKNRSMLILPNIWDVIGAKLLENIGYPAVATASMSVAYSKGIDDGEIISFKTHLRISKEIADSVNIPLSVDIEKGYSESLQGLTDNIHALIKSGVVGINIEDSKNIGNSLETIETQCEKIKTIRNAANQKGVHMFINARTDVFINEQIEPHLKVKETIKRANAYKNAGADCLYPILLDDLDDIQLLISEIKMPINLFLTKKLINLKMLEEIGVSRLSLGPLFFKKALASMEINARNLLHYNAESIFQPPTMTTDFIRQLII